MITKPDQITKLPPVDYGLDPCMQTLPGRDWRKLKLSLASLLLTSALFTIILTSLLQIISLIRPVQQSQLNSRTNSTKSVTFLSGLALKPSSIVVTQHQSPNVISVKRNPPTVLSTQITVNVTPSSANSIKFNFPIDSVYAPRTVVINSLPRNKTDQTTIQLIVKTK